MLYQLGNDLYSGKKSFDFVGKRKIWFSVAVIAIAIALGSLLFRGLNLGVDFTGGSQHPDHAASVNGHFSAAAHRGIDNLLNSVHVGSEGGHNNPAARIFIKNGLDRFADRPFRHGKSFTQGIGGVAAKSQYPFLSQLCKAGQIDRISVNRGIVHFKVAGMNHGSCGTGNRESGVIRNAVVRTNILYLKIAGCNRHAIADNFPLCHVFHAQFFELTVN